MPAALLLVASRATEEVDDVVDASGAEAMFIIGFILVGIIGAVIAARSAKRSRDQAWRDEFDAEDTA